MGSDASKTDGLYLPFLMMAVISRCLNSDVSIPSAWQSPIVSLELVGQDHQIPRHRIFQNGPAFSVEDQSPVRIDRFTVNSIINSLQLVLR
jgi:hypothetical protein